MLSKRLVFRITLVLFFFHKLFCDCASSAIVEVEVSGQP